MLYSDLIKEIAIRLDAVVGSTGAAKEASLSNPVPTISELGSTDFPLSNIRRTLLSSVSRIIRTYAGIKNHPFRQYNLSQTANIAHKGQIPFVNSASKPIVGVFGAVRDATTGDILTEQPVQLIESIRRSQTDSSLKGSYFYYKIADSRIYHTRTNVVIDVVTFDAATEKIAIAAGSASILPDACFDIAWTAALGLMMIDDSYQNQAAVYQNYATQCLNEMKMGAVNFQPAPEHVGSNAVGVS